MKKILLILFILFFSFVSFANSYSPSNKDKKIINHFIQKINLISEKKWDNFKKNLLKALERQTKTKKFNKKTSYILSEVINILKKDINQTNKLLDKKAQKEFSNKKTELKKYGVDFLEVKNYLFWLYSKTRQERGLKKYKYSEKLEKTAFLWSEAQKMKKSSDHKRNIWDPYYSHNKITTWFKNRGVVCKNINRTTNTENIWWWNIYCENGDCSKEIKESIWKVFEFYMDEEWKAYDPHFRSVVSKELSYIWFGLSIEEIKKNHIYKYYLTIHFCTEFID